jgi:membrane-associated phospholipid phosphatase
MAADLDARIYRYFRSALLHRQGAEPMILAVIRAQNWWAPAGLATMIADRDRRPAWAHANTVVAIAWATAKLLSRAIKRPRPHFVDCPPARLKTDRESFPSTHATVSFAAAVAVTPLLPTTPLHALATATAIARLLLGEHYPSDVAAGAILGIGIAAPFCRRRPDPRRPVDSRGAFRDRRLILLLPSLLVLAFEPVRQPSERWNRRLHDDEGRTRRYL